MAGQLHEGLEVTWLGHGVWLFRSPGGKRILVDPWLRGNPACPAPYNRGDVGPLDLILVTHGHGDHIGDVVDVAQRTGAPVVGIFDLTTWLTTKGVRNSVGMNKGGTQAIQGLKITLTHADHSACFMDGDRLVNLGEACGLIVELEDGYRLYHAGDTAVFGDMRLIAELYRPDVAILPIGDHFTMGPREAAKAVELLGVKTVLPTHFGTFPLLTGTPEAFRELLPDDVTLHVLKPGQSLG